MARKKIGEMLLEEGVLDETRLRAALIEQQRWGGPLGRLLVEMRLIDERTLVDALSRQLHIPATDLESGEIPRHVIDLVPGELCEQYSLMPFSAPMKFLDLAMADPTNLGVIDELQIRTHRNIRPHLAGPKQIERAIARYYGRGSAFGFRRAGSTTTAPPNQPIEITPSRRDEKMEIVRGLDMGTGDGPPGMGIGSSPGRDAEVQALQQRVSRLEALVARDENVLRKVLSLLVEKGVATREEIVERLK
jgi:type IV pilus assembly protein PilB